ncbi:MAG: hypothetical protein GY787_31505 [Alteromonadales bacterium]|nr:hypothetical protein [Alteromonadales bacterium]
MAKITGFVIGKIQTIVINKILMAIPLFMLLLILPLADEIIAGFHFRSLCKQGNKLSYDVANIKGKMLLSTLGHTRKIESIIPIEEHPHILRDIDSGKPLVTYKKYSTTGGRLISALGMGGHGPITYGHRCGAKEELETLENKYGIEIKYKKLTKEG